MVRRFCAGLNPWNQCSKQWWAFTEPPTEAPVLSSPLLGDGFTVISKRISHWRVTVINVSSISSAGFLAPQGQSSNPWLISTVYGENRPLVISSVSLLSKPLSFIVGFSPGRARSSAPYICGPQRHAVLSASMASTACSTLSCSPLRRLQLWSLINHTQLPTTELALLWSPLSITAWFLPLLKRHSECLFRQQSFSSDFILHWDGNLLMEQNCVLSLFRWTNWGYRKWNNLSSVKWEQVETLGLTPDLTTSK